MLKFVTLPTVSYTICEKNKELFEGNAPIKIASFDFDHTICNPKEGRKLANGPDDWEWCDKSVPQMLTKYKKEGYLVVIFTNQKGVSVKKAKIEDLHQKFEHVCQELGFEMDFFMALNDDYYRKPCTGLWKLFLEQYGEILNGKKSDDEKKSAENFKMNIDFEKSFYCGDAGGRPKNWMGLSRKKDFSSSDMLFAHNISILEKNDFHFVFPEELFTDFGCPERHGIEWMKQCQSKYDVNLDPFYSFDKEKNPTTNLQVKFKSETELKTETPKREFIMMIGPPASGKSTHVKKYHKLGYTIINQDNLKTKKKCLKLTRDALMRGESIVIDNTNPSAKVREEYLTMVIEQNAKLVKEGENEQYIIGGILMTTPKEICLHLNGYRCETVKMKRIPQIAYNIFFSRFETPVEKEGFDWIKNHILTLDRSRISQEIDFWF